MIRRLLCRLALIQHRWRMTGKTVEYHGMGVWGWRCTNCGENWPYRTREERWAR